jgi:two-component system, OmpR family, sensor kinase
LRWRLAAGAAGVIVACLGIAFVAVYKGTGTQVRRQIDTQLSGDGSDFARTLTLASPRSASQARGAAVRYLRGQPFSASSTLQFAIVPGAGTSANSLELFAGGAPDDGETLAEQERENSLTTRLLAARAGYSTLLLPDVGDLRLFKRTLRLPGLGQTRRPVVIGVGEPLAPVARAQRGVARAFILAGILALTGTLLGAFLIGTRTSRPLRRMASIAARVDAGDLAPRIDATGQAHEIRVLADAFNHMLDRLAEAFAGQRAFVADASHELRTPLTVIRGQLEVLASHPNPPGAEVRRVEQLVDAEISRMSRLVDDLLLLAKAEQPQFLRIEPIELTSFLGQLWNSMAMLAERRFELGPVPTGILRADPDRLAQALRNLLANAVAHTANGSGSVLMSAHPAPGGRLMFLVEDDGPGIPDEERERVFDRFHRIDAARDRASGGTGLGLAIVDAIAKAHGGGVRASGSELGGARIELVLPHFTPARRSADRDPPARAATVADENDVPTHR